MKKTMTITFFFCIGVTFGLFSYFIVYSFYTLTSYIRNRVFENSDVQILTPKEIAQLKTLDYNTIVKNKKQTINRHSKILLVLIFDKNIVDSVKENTLRKIYQLDLYIDLIFLKNEMPIIKQGIQKICKKYKFIIIFKNIFLTSNLIFIKKILKENNKNYFHKKIHYKLNFSFNNNFKTPIILDNILQLLKKKKTDLVLCNIHSSNCAEVNIFYQTLNSFHQLKNEIKQLFVYEHTKLILAINELDKDIKSHYSNCYNIESTQVRKDHEVTDIIPWVYLNSSFNFLLPNEIYFEKSLSDQGKVFVRHLLSELRRSSNLTGEVIHSGLMRFVPESGIELHLNAQVDRRFRVVLPLSLPEPVLSVNTAQYHENNRFSLVVVRVDNHHLATSLLHDFRWNCVHLSEPVYLLLYVPDCGGRMCAQYRPLRRLSRGISARYSTPDLIRVRTLSRDTPDSRALDMAADLVSGDSTLLWSHTAAVVLSSELLRRVNLLLNSLRYQVLTPVPFQQYNLSLFVEKADEVSSVDLHRDQGRFDPLGFPVVIIGAADWKSVRRTHTDQTPLEVVLSSKLSVLRHTEPALLLRWRSSVCRTRTPEQCSQIVAPQHELAKLASAKRRQGAS